MHAYIYIYVYRYICMRVQKCIAYYIRVKCIAYYNRVCGLVQLDSNKAFVMCRSLTHHTHTHTYIHTQTHKHKHTHTQTHKHTLSCLLVQQEWRHESRDTVTGGIILGSKILVRTLGGNSSGEAILAGR